MSSRTFVDTNVVVYLFDDDEPVKQRQARERLATSDTTLVVSSQVLSEFYVTVTRKLARPLPPDVARRAVALLTELVTVGVDADLVTSAISTSQRHHVSLWDALIVEAASSAGCDELLSEDLAAGTQVHGVKIVNPFAA